MIRIVIERDNPLERPKLEIYGADRDVTVATLIAALTEMEVQYREAGHGLVVKRSLLEILRGDEWDMVTAVLAAENECRKREERKHGKETDD